MKKLTIFFALSLINITAFAQRTEGWCAMDRLVDRQIEESGLTREQFYHQYVENMEQPFDAPATRATYTIPVVVHVLHNNGDGNISEAQILDALDILTKDYSRQNADTSDTRNTANAPFKPVAGALDVQFKLAKYDPDHNCTNGIVRVNTTITDVADMENEPHKHTSLGGSDAWDPSRYFNIWVVNNILDPSLPPGYIVLGYAQFPGWGDDNTYGVTIRADAMGSIEVANGSDGRTLTHEAGHCFGLFHIFQGDWFGGDGCHTNNCTQNGDLICDTPPQQQDFYTCSQTLNSCTGVPTNDAFGFDTYDQIENFMSYNTCQNMFTQDQMTRMESILNSNALLETVISDTNVIWTGVNEAEQLCQALFEASKTNICAGGIVQFTDYSYFNPTIWTWSVSPGTEGVDYVFVNSTTSASQNPEIQFLTENTYSITLEISDGSSSVSNTESNLITILPQAAQIPFIEKFENIADLNNTSKWTPVLVSGSEMFEIFNGFGHTGTRCAGVNNFAQSNGGSTELIASPLDLSVLDPGAGDIVTMSFRYAYRKRSAVDDEWLRVYVSNDCGDTWVLRKAIHGNLLGSVTASTSWQPSSQADWETVHVINITETFMVDNMMYKFVFDGNGGNNIYIDNINIYAGSPSDELVIGIEEESQFTNFHLYPNPSEGELNIGFSTEASGNAVIEITDISGKVVLNNNFEINAGNNLVNINAESLSDGAYLVNLNLDGAKITRRFIKQ